MSDKSGTPNASGISAPTISLPKGGGAIRGMGEKFAANPVTGTGSMSIPLAVSPGRAGFGLQLSLSYDSGSGNGPFGFGWSLSLPSITRKTDKGLPQYRDAEASDVFILSGAEDLVPVLELNAQGKWVQEPVPSRTVDNKTYDIQRYRPRVEGLFARIERWTNIANGETHWRSMSKDNITTIYGKDNNSRIFDPAELDKIDPADLNKAHPTHVFTWLICQSYDDKGNSISYEYVAENGAGVDLAKVHEHNRGDKTDPKRTANRYLKRIHYSNSASTLAGGQPILALGPDLSAMKWLFEVVFDYGEGHYQSLSAQADDPQFVRAQPDAPTDAWPVRQDPFSTYRAGYEVRTYRLCRRVLVFHHFETELGTPDCLVRSTDFVYREESIASFITSVTQSGYVCPDVTADPTRYRKKSLPPVEFDYTRATINPEVKQVSAESIENLPIGLDGATYQWVDLDGEGVSGILTKQVGAWFYKRNLSPLPKSNGSGTPEVRARFAPLERIASLPSLAAASSRHQFLDLAGDGTLDLVEFSGPTPGFYERTNYEDWEPFTPFRLLPNLSWDAPDVRFVDLDGDGRADVLVTEDEVFTWYRSLGEYGFEPGMRVHQPRDEERGPRLVSDSPTERIYLADLSGDGLTDLVRIRRGEVCYWPNLGYGRFGSKVTMDNSPRFDRPDVFDQKRIRLADIDGSGTTDIVYLGANQIAIYRNQSGNSFNDAEYLTAFPRVDNLTSVQAVDLLGNGTACLVWSSPLPGDAGRQMRYIDLMGGQKPHLLVKTVNNLGAETVVSYAPSTKFYLQDKRDGKPWITRLPFPVHVVERVETYDHISRNRFGTRYAYHHGYFDGEEREFRGFGMVEQWDTEELAALMGNGTLPTATNVDTASHVPPVLTKTWFHTGVYLGREHISDFFAGLLDAEDKGEYYREPGLTDQEAAKLGLDDEARRFYDDARAKDRLLDDTVLPQNLTLEEEREACRALKGAMLRQEVYALDGTSKQQHPYTVSEQNFTIERVQPRGGNRHAVFFTHPREAITYHYERNPVDPRIQHALTLEVDLFGNVRESAMIGYGRRFDSTDVALLPEDRQKQRLIHITCTESSFTDPIVDQADAYRTPLPAETRTYELRRPEQEKSGNGLTDLYGFDEILGHVNQSADGSHDVAYEDIQFATAKQAAVSDTNEGKKYFRRLIEHVRTLYRPNDLGAAQNDPLALLPVGKLESQALPGESYKLVFTPSLLQTIYVDTGKLPTSDFSNVLGTDGGYVHSEGDANWWIPAGRVFYSPTINDLPAAELAFARAHFFLPHRYRDPFGQHAFVGFDANNLLMVETRDALGNRLTVDVNDYRVLQPSLVSDPNRNQTEVDFDTLGMVVGTAVMGKPLPAPVEGDSLTPFKADLTQAEIDDFHAAADPHTLAVALLQGATTRIVYDLDRFQRTQRANPQDPTKWLPPYAATLARETHFNNPLPPQGLKIQISFSYSDGFGREIQKKIQAEPEKVGGVVGQPRWVGSGWVIFNNKGKPIRQYEPFFSTYHEFQFGKEVGVSPILFYDPIERVVATLHPNNTYEKVVFDPWHQTTWDVNDTLHPPQNAGDPPFDPKDDPDVGGYLGRLPNSEYLPTWYDLRTDAAKALQQWSDTDPSGNALPDNAKRRNGEKNAATKAALHAHTPTVAHFDALGRPFLTLAHNRFQRETQAGAIQTVEEKYATRIELDIEGNQREVRDAIVQAGDKQGRIVMRYDYDLLGNRIHQTSMEAGARWMLNDVAGKPVYAWDSRNHQFRTAYDPLRRPTDSLLRDGAGTELRVGRTVYGETQANPEINNLRGKVVQVFDQAGSVTSGNYDFKGNLRWSQRQLARDYKTVLNWSAVVPLEAETFTSRTTYDALNRPLTATSPDGSVYRPTFNEANLLDKVEVNLRGAVATTPFVTNIDYDAKGQRQRIDYGNGASTVYDYDPLTFRLVHLLTQRNAVTFPADCPKSPPAGWPGCQVQNLHYTYDPVGNITHIQDDAQQTIYFSNQRVEPSNDYTYDALYRLIQANGREHLGQQANGDRLPPSTPDAFNTFHTRQDHPNALKAMGTYIERYVYDAVGNFLQMQHRGSDPVHPGWTRSYEYNEDSQTEPATPAQPAKKSNRLSSTTIGSSAAEPYTYDAHGNMTSMPHLPLMHWDYHDQLQATAQQVVNNGIPETTYYVYDANGQRVRKITERAVTAAELASGKQPTMMKERIYLGGFEIYREYNGSAGTTLALERQTLHIMDDKQRIALVETKTTDVSVPASTLPETLIRYQFGNHLGSASLELDDQAQIISYEEYAPYGSSTYQAVRSQIETPKRYRYTGKERDEESGLYYHGARYYAPLFGRWINCDPNGLKSGQDGLYVYVRNSPVVLHDPTGKEEEASGLVQYYRGVSIISEIVAGDFHEGESTWTGTLINVGVGLIPYVGQVADVRDTGAAVKNVGDKPNSWGSWGMLGMAVIGWVPALGDAAKGLSKVGSKATVETGKMLAQKAGKEGIDMTKKAGKATAEVGEKAAKQTAEKETKKIAPGLGEQMIKEEKKSGLNVDLATQEHRHKTEYRKESGKDVQSAHMVNSSSVKDLSDYARDRAVTALLPTKSHKAFDDYWKKWAREKLANAKPGEELKVTVAEWEKVLNEAAGSVPELKGRTADTMSFMIHTELYQTLGLKPDQLIRIPFSQ